MLASNSLFDTIQNLALGSVAKDINKSVELNFRCLFDYLHSGFRLIGFGLISIILQLIKYIITYKINV